MNQIFKVVFNAARGKKMVVNEATSSVQKGKMAAVTVAVAGALMLGANVAGAKPLGGENLSGKVTEDPGVGVSDVLTLTVNEELYGQTIDDEVISGHYFGINPDTTYLHGQEKTFNIQSTTTNISGNVTVVEGVFGGSKVAGGFGEPDTNSPAVTLVLNTNSTDLTIEDGVFGTYDTINKADCSQCEFAMRKVVTAGDFVKDRGLNYGAPVKIETSIKDANLTIHGGTFHSTVFGGSVLSNYAYDQVNMNAKVDKTTVTITGGTFKSAVFAGGAAMNLYGGAGASGTLREGSEIVSEVTEANLIIQGGDFEQGIYTGGLEGYLEGKEPVRITTKATVEKANVTVVNSNVSAIRGHNAKGVMQVEGDKGTGWEFTNLTEEEDDVVDTDLQVINSTVETIDVTEGEVELRVEGVGEESVTSVNTLTLGKEVDVTMSGDGTFNDATGGDVDALAERITIKNVQIGDTESETLTKGTVRLDEGSVMGVVTAKINEKGEIVEKTVAVNDKTDSLTNKVVHIPQIINRIMMNDVRKRMGDIRSAEGTHGAWVRYNGGEMSGRGIENDFNMIQVGFDTMPGADAPRFGVAFSYANSEAEDGYGTADMDAYSLAAYATKFYDNGMFVDVIGRLAKIDTDLENVGRKGQMDNLAVSLSGEFGWRFDVTKSLYVEPAVEATYTYMDSDEFTLGQGEYELESTDSFIGRAGIAAGFKCPANKGDVYVRAAVAHEFLGDATMNSSINGNRALAVELDGKDTWVEFGLGANFNVNESTYVYADVERTEGAAIDEDWRANVGVRFAF